jgi:hypothetical protein
MSDSVNEGEVRVSITSPSPSRPPLPPSRNLPPAGTTPHVPSNLPVLTASDSPDEFGDEGIEDEDDGAETSDHVSDLLAAAAERNGKYNQQVDLHTGLNLTQSSSSNNIVDTSNASNDQNELHKKDSFTSTTASLKLDAHTKPTTPHSGGGGEEEELVPVQVHLVVLSNKMLLLHLQEHHPCLLHKQYQHRLTLKDSIKAGFLSNRHHCNTCL